MPEYINPDPSRFNVLPDGGCSCKRCGGDIHAIPQTRSIWYENGPGPCAGSGETETVAIPYCPKCDPVPSSRGVTFQ